jgi:hypothetical protein
LRSSQATSSRLKPSWREPFAAATTMRLAGTSAISYRIARGTLRPRTMRASTRLLSRAA